MLSAEAHIATERPGRYLAQLSRHGSQMRRRLHHRPGSHGGGDAPPEVRHAEWSDTHGLIDFGWGRCTLQATAEGLMLRVEAENEAGFQRIQYGITRRLETIGRRDAMKVRWDPSAEQTAPSTEAPLTAPARDGDAPAQQGRRRTIGLTALVALTVAVHLGLGGGLLAQWRWTGPVVDVVLALAVVKALVIGRFAVRRSKASNSSAR